MARKGTLTTLEAHQATLSERSYITQHCSVFLTHVRACTEGSLGRDSSWTCGGGPTHPRPTRPAASAAVTSSSASAATRCSTCLVECTVGPS